MQVLTVESLGAATASERTPRAAPRQRPPDTDHAFYEYLQPRCWESPAIFFTPLMIRRIARVERGSMDVLQRRRFLASRSEGHAGRRGGRRSARARGVAERDERPPPGYAFRAISSLCRLAALEPPCIECMYKIQNVVNAPLACGSFVYEIGLHYAKLREAYSLIVACYGQCNVTVDKRWTANPMFADNVQRQSAFIDEQRRQSCVPLLTG
ncbi:unnamed protein product [Leptosia nina]|uniref:Uncharacterized protein n=1 Tax=Leptosia nina TaxID=320188 RepID=A0AAV1K2W7_9NEOP